MTFGRVTTEQLTAALTDKSAGVQVTVAFSVSAGTDKTLGVQTTQVHFDVAYSDRTHGTQITNLFLVFAAPYPTLDLTDGAGGSIFGGNLGESAFPQFTANSPSQYIAVPAGNLEPNPYAPIVNEAATQDMPPEVAAVMGPQQEMLRKQHNVTQAGDTTFPWDLLLQHSLTPQHNLGARGRVFTPDFGVVQCVYVQFTDILIGNFTNGTMPFGRVAGSTEVDWRVTNDITKSVGQALGVAMLSDVPPDNSYGWLTYWGANVASLLCLSPGQMVADETYIWDKSGSISRGAGRVIARAWMDGGHYDPGQVFITVEGLNDAGIKGLFDSNLSAIEQSIAALSAAVTALQQNQDTETIAENLAKVSASLTQLQKDLANEILLRTKGDADLRAAIAGSQVTLDEFNDYKTDLSAQLEAINTQLQVASRTAAQAKAVTDQLNPVRINQLFANLQSQIDQLRKLLNDTLNVIAALGTPVIPLLPLTVGTPPGFFWFDDGKYMITETRT